MTAAALALFPVFAFSSTLRQWSYDGALTLEVDVREVRAQGGIRAAVDVSAALPMETVERWTDESMRDALEDGSSNPAYQKPRGYRIGLVVRMAGQPVQLEMRPRGTGPLGDWVGVHATRVGPQAIWKRSGRIRGRFLHDLSGPPCEYEITWWVDGKVAHSETLRIPLREEEGAGGIAGTTSANQGVGTYAAGAGLGATYGFEVAPRSDGGPETGSGTVVAALAPAAAREALGLAAAPVDRVLVGWQADGGHGISVLLGPGDAGLGVAPEPPPIEDFAPGARVEAGADLRALRLPAAGTDWATVLSTAPGAKLEALQSGRVFVESGTVRVSGPGDGVAIVTGLGPVDVAGLALVDVTAERVEVWALTHPAQVAGLELRPNERATWDGTELVRSKLKLDEMAPAFLRTCFPAREPATAEEPLPAATSLTGLIREAVLCDGVDGSNRPLDPRSRFAAGTGSINLFVEHALPDKQYGQVALALSREGEQISTHGVSVNGSGKFLMEFRPVGHPDFEAGHWTIRIEVDGRLDRELSFTVGM